MFGGYKRALSSLHFSLGMDSLSIFPSLSHFDFPNLPDNCKGRVILMLLIPFDSGALSLHEMMSLIVTPSAKPPSTLSCRPHRHTSEAAGTQATQQATTVSSQSPGHQGSERRTLHW
eukprot:1115294-Pyramimonas_sp.AAC.1